MSGLVTYELRDSIATIVMDDGKVNALSLEMLGAVNGALDRAVSDAAVVVLTGREGIFSAGFDLKVLRGGGADAGAMLLGGFELAVRLLAFPTPVVVACTGHAVAMGVFLLLSGDYRDWRGGRVQPAGERGGDRAADAADGCRDFPAAAGAGALQPGGDPRGGVRAGGRCCGGVPRPRGAGGGGAGRRSGRRGAAGAAQHAGAHGDEAAGARVGAGGDPRGDGGGWVGGCG